MPDRSRAGRPDTDAPTRRARMSHSDVPSTNFSRADIGLVCALPLELAEFLGRCQRVKVYSGGSFKFRGGIYDGIRIAVVESGVGPWRATRATQALIDAHQPRWIVSTGLAGALSDDVKIGHLVVADRLRNAAGDELSIDIGMTSDSARGLHVGRLLTVDHIVRTVVEKRSLAAETGALAVDMESFSVATVSRLSKTRFMAVRAISDDLSEDLPPEVLSLVGETGAVRLGAVLGSLLKRPSSLQDMWRLRERATTAATRLADFLHGIVVQLHQFDS